MRLSKSYIIYLLIILVILNIILRAPITPHEVGWDSFTVHALANSVSQFGYAKWWIHPASIGGFYPYSEESVVPFIISGISQCTNIDIEWTIWLFCLFIGVFSAFTAYLMAGEIKDDALFKYLVAFSFSTSTGVLYFTTWTISSRGFFIILLPLFIYLLLRIRTSIVRYTTLIFLMFVVLALTHHLFYFMIPIIFSFIIVAIFYKLKEFISFIEIPSILFSLGFLIFFISVILFVFISGLFFQAPSKYIIEDILMTYARYTGVLIIFAFGGFFWLIFKSNRTFNEWFVIVTLLSLMTAIGNLTYTKWVILVVIFILIGIGLLNTTRTFNKKRLAHTALVIAILSSVSMAGFYQVWSTNIEQKGIPSYWTRFTSDSIYKSALWAEEEVVGNMIAYGGMTPVRVLAYSGVPTLTGSHACDLTYGFVNLTKFNIERRPISMKWIEDEPYTISPKKVQNDWFVRNLYKYRIDSEGMQNFFSKHKISYIIENSDVPGGKFFMSVYNSREKIYNNGKARVWLYK